MFKNKHDRVIYVGKAKDLKNRVSSYFKNNKLDAKTIKLVSEIKSVETIPVNSEIEAFLLEAALIKKYKTFYNVKLADDKSYPYIKFGKTPFPYVAITHKTDDNQADYFGPYVNSADVKIVLKILRRIFPYQSVKNHPKRNCLYFHLAQCPCIPLHPESNEAYFKNIKRLKSFLMGKTKSVFDDLKREQSLYVKKEEYEQAGQIQKKIEQIEYVTSKNYSPFSYMERPDGYYRRLEEELLSLKKILQENGLTPIHDLSRIECFDISNIQGKQATGSMVVFTSGDSNKAEYRRFKIKTKQTPDDFAMHQEVMRRRLKNTQWPYPNLMVVDGGKGQVSSVMRILKEANIDIPLIGLAKRLETIVIPYPTYNNNYDYKQINLPHDTPGVNLLRRSRDEAHRFAISYHRKLRQKLIR